MNKEGYDLEQRVLDKEHSVYPGHPVTVGLLIMERYNTIDEALHPTIHGWPEAVGDGAIPGAGSEVHAAVHLLRSIALGERTPEEAVAYARKTWHAGGHVDNVVPAQEQADRFTIAYLTKAASWFAPAGIVPEQAGAPVP